MLFYWHSVEGHPALDARRAQGLRWSCFVRQFEGLAKVYSLMFSTPRMRAQPCSFSGGCQDDSQPWLGGLPLPTAGLAKGLSISCFRACRLPGRGGSSLGRLAGLAGFSGRRERSDRSPENPARRSAAPGAPRRHAAAAKAPP